MATNQEYETDSANTSTKIPPLTLDEAFLDDPKILSIADAWRQGEAPAEATMLILKLWFTMWRSGRVLRAKFLPAVARKLGLTKTELSDFLALCVEFELLVKDSDEWFSNGLNARWASWAKKSKAASIPNRAKSKEPEKAGAKADAKASAPADAHEVICTDMKCIEVKGSDPNIPNSAKTNLKLVPTPGGVHSPNNVPNTKLGTPPGFFSPEVLAPDADEFEVAAFGFLEHPDGTKPWETNNFYMQLGRRPMVGHPLLWFSPPELAALLKDYDPDVPDRSQMSLIWMLLETKIKKKHADRPDQAPTFDWAMNWFKTELLKKFNEEIKSRKNRARAAQ